MEMVSGGLIETFGNIFFVIAEWSPKGQIVEEYNK